MQPLSIGLLVETDTELNFTVQYFHCLYNLHKYTRLLLTRICVIELKISF